MRLRIHDARAIQNSAGNRICAREKSVSSGEQLAYAHQTSKEDGMIMEGCRLAEVYDVVLDGPSMLMLRAWHQLKRCCNFNGVHCTVRRGAVHMYAIP